MPEFVDIAFIADPRFPGGSSTALASEISAAYKAGLSAGLVPIQGGVLKRSWPFHPDIEALLQDGACRLIEPRALTHTAIAVAHHPKVFEALPFEPLNLTTESLFLVLHHPLYDGSGRRQYRVGQVASNLEAMLGKRPILAPVGPNVRTQLTYGAVEDCEIAAEDWCNLLDLARWPARDQKPPSDRILIGRHSRPDPQKWPDDLQTALQAYPLRRDFKISMLGGGPFLGKKFGGSPPGHWDMIPFGTIDVSTYLRSLDFYVYYHSDIWIEAFGRAILEALATGLVVILPSHFETLFGEAAVYVEAAGVEATIDNFVAHPEAYFAQSKRARSSALRHFDLTAFVPRLERLTPGWGAGRATKSVAAPPQTAMRKKTALIFTSNGVGLGHLTRMLAVADRLSNDMEVVFFTLSQGAHLVREAGYLTEYRPFHRATGAGLRAWNNALAVELTDAISFYGADILVFDGNTPYSGLCTAIKQSPTMKSIWVRRGFWAPHQRGALERSKYFDAVIEPDDIASSLDDGPTRKLRDDVFVCPPIVRADPSTRLDRTDARRELGLPQDATIVAVSLGSGSNFDLADLEILTIEHLSRQRDVLVVALRSPIRAKRSLVHHDHALELSHYPIFPMTNAFDFMVSTCGYNAFHEAMLGAIPTVFIPNEASEMDLQYQRARFADAAGAGAVIRRHEMLSAPRVLDHMLNPATRDHMRERCGMLFRENGSEKAAQYILTYSTLRRTAV
ncbi:MAG: hypothetical protein KTR21_02260 [Rhodobacteraceae bacterium]|nr:hypothetical protein [Paracoccaceae bacterium]